MNIKTTQTGFEIAVIGMSGVFPGAENIDKFWQNLLEGKSGISTFLNDELAEAGVYPDLLELENFIKVKGMFPGIQYFDNKFFDYTPKDSELLDPQVRALHQCVYHALEDSGYISEDHKGNIGLFAGSSGNFAWELSTLMDVSEGSANQFSAIQLNDKDFAATRIAYKLNLRGPSVALHTACSTSLYAIDMACRQLLTGSCSVAVAAGSGFNLPHKNGYVYETGMILSPDGVCRPFSDEANGTVEGNGMAAVVLKPLEDAIRDRDNIYAVIKGTGANNDGKRKVGFTAPSVEGQAEAIRRSIHMADVDPQTITYVESHGTGTSLGDPVEIEGLKKAFRSDKKQFCGIGSLKSNIGHLDTAAGISSFVKAVKSLETRQLAPSINFSSANPEIDFENSPFYVVQHAKAWENELIEGKGSQFHPLRAGVSSFGIGGTNVHVVLEEAPKLAPSETGRDWNVLCLSGLDAAALNRVELGMTDYLLKDNIVDVADLAYTSQVCKRHLENRSVVIYSDIKNLTESLISGEETFRRFQTVNHKKKAAFLFSGQGTQYPGMALGVYNSEPVFREVVDKCLSICESHGVNELRQLLLCEIVSENEIQQLNDTQYAQLGLFIVEYAMARQLMHWGVTPKVMIGHSLGEFVAACLSGVINLEHVLELIVARGLLMRKMPAGSMLVVSASKDDIDELIQEDISIAALNTPTQLTLSGPSNKIENIAKELTDRGIEVKALHTSHAFHSSMMEPVLEPFRQVLNKVEFNAPEIPYISNVTGTWITADEAQDTEYYLRHLRGTVNFSQGAVELINDTSLVFVEAGPGTVLSTFIKQNALGQKIPTVATLRHVKKDDSDQQFLAKAVGDLWGHGLELDWNSFYKEQVRSKVGLPPYPFEKTVFPIGKGDIYSLLSNVAAPQQHQSGQISNANVLTPVWQNSLIPTTSDSFSVLPCLVFQDGKSLSKAVNLVSGLRITQVKNKKSFVQKKTGLVWQNFDSAMDYRRLFNLMKKVDGVPNLFLWVAKGIDTMSIELWSQQLVKFAAILRSEVPGQVVKGVIAVKSDHASSADGMQISRRLDSILRSLRTEYPELDLRCVLISGSTEVNQEAIYLEREIYDKQTDVVLVEYHKGRRLIYRWIETDVSSVNVEVLKGSTLGVIARDGFPVKELADSVRELTGAEVIPLSFQENLIDKSVSSFTMDYSTVNDFIKQQDKQLLSQYGIHDFSESHALMDEACTVLVAGYISKYISLDVGQQFSQEELKRKLKVTDRLDNYVEYFIMMFLADKLIEGSGPNYTVIKSIDSLRDYATIKSELESKNSLFTGSLEVLEHCIKAFPDALPEKVPTISVLYPDGTNQMLAHAHSNSIQELEEEALHSIFEKIFKRMVDSAGDRPIRILEAGGGFGLTMKRLAPLLKGMNVEYYFTDIGRTFIYDARAFALETGCDFLTLGVFDITKSPEEQGIEEGTFDFVFAFNVVHATKSISQSMRNLEKLLRSGGWMCFLERTAINRYVDLTWGLADGWWHFDKQEREISPLIELDRWEALAKEVGFDLVTSYPQDAESRSKLEMGILLAQKTSKSSESNPLSTIDRWSFPNIDSEQPLDGVILVEPYNGIYSGVYEPYGDRISQVAIDKTDFIDQACQWLKNVNPKFVATMSMSGVVNSIADQVENSRANQDIAQHVGNLVGEENAISLHLPMSKNDVSAIPDKDVLRNALNVVVGRLGNGAIDSENLDFLNLPVIESNAEQIVLGNEADFDSENSQLSGVDKNIKLVEKIWSDLFGIDNIALDDDFFEIGGDSLKVAQMMAALEKQGLDLLANEIFNNPTIRLLANYIHRHCQSEYSQIASIYELAEHFKKEKNVESASKNIKEGDFEYRLLFVEDAKYDDKVAVEDLFSGLRLPPEAEPHFIFPLTQFVDSDSNLEERAHWEPYGFLDNGVDEIDAITDKVQRELQLLAEKICSTKVVDSYKLSPFQKTFLKKSNRFAFYIIDFDEPLNYDLLDSAFSDIVGLQGLMRSQLSRGFLKQASWKEHAAHEENLQIPLVDISKYSPIDQPAIVEKIMEWENGADFDIGTGIMFRLMLIKLDRRRHTLLFNLDHSIFDNMSGQVLRRQLVNRYREIYVGNRAPMEPIKTFQNYLEQLNVGPQGINKKRLIDLFELERFKEVKDIVETRIVERRTGEIKKVRFELDLAKYNLSDDDESTWELSLVLLCNVLSKFLEVKEIPLKLIYQGRQYQDVPYFDTLGLFIDILPLLVRVDGRDPASMIEDVRKKVRFVNRYNVSFMNMLLNLNKRFSWWEVLSKLEPKKISKTDPMILLNYVGKAEAEYQKIIDFTTKQLEKSEDTAGYASLYMIVTVIDNNILFDLFCNFEDDMDSLGELFHQEADRLFGTSENVSVSTEGNSLDQADNQPIDTTESVSDATVIKAE